MIRRVIQALASEVRGMHSAAYVLGTFAILSSLLGFLRDRALAHTFGAGEVLDVYYAAFRIPDLIFVGVASLVSAYILIPELAARGDDQQRAYVENILAWFSVFIAGVGLLVFVAAPAVLAVFFPSLLASSSGSLVLLTRILLLQPILLGFSNIVAAVVQYRGRYVLYATAPLLYNVGIIAGVVLLYPFLGISGLAWGVVLGAGLHLGVQLPAFVGGGFLSRLPRFGAGIEFLHTIRISLPRTIALSASQVTLLVFAIIAGAQAAGSLAVFTLAFNLQSVPLAVIGASYSVAAFPTLAKAFGIGAREEFVSHVRQAAQHILFWTLPVTGLVVVLRAYVVRVVLGSGQFDWADTRLTAAALALFCLGLAANALLLLLTRAFYAAGRSAIPLVVNVCSAAFAVLLGLVLTRIFEGTGFSLFLESLLRVEDVPGTIVLMLPLAYACSMLVAAGVLAYAFERSFGGLLGGLGRVLGEGIAASGVAAAVAYAVLSALGGISSATTFLAVLYYGACAGIAGGLSAIVLLALLGSRELAEVSGTLHRRWWRGRVLHSAEEEIS